MQVTCRILRIITRCYDEDQVCFVYHLNYLYSTFYLASHSESKGLQGKYGEPFGCPYCKCILILVKANVCYLFVVRKLIEPRELLCILCLL